jgi:hypothetical protein
MKNLKLPSLVPSLAVQTLASVGLVASVMFSAKPAQAASLQMYNWSLNSQVDGQQMLGGTLVVDEATGLLSSFADTGKSLNFLPPGAGRYRNNVNNIGIGGGNES